MISHGLRRWCVCQVEVTDTVTSPESAERKPLEASSTSLPEALSAEAKEESTDMPVEKNEVEPRDDEAVEKTEVDPSDDHVEEKTASTHQIDAKEVDQNEDEVMRHFNNVMYNGLPE